MGLGDASDRLWNGPETRHSTGNHFVIAGRGEEKTAGGERGLDRAGSRGGGRRRVTSQDPQWDPRRLCLHYPEVPRGAVGRSRPCLPSGGAVLICGLGWRLRPLHSGGLFYLHQRVGRRGWLAVHHSCFPTAVSCTVFLSFRKHR